MLTVRDNSFCSSFLQDYCISFGCFLLGLLWFKWKHFLYLMFCSAVRNFLNCTFFLHMGIICINVKYNWLYHLISHPQHICIWDDIYTSLNCCNNRWTSGMVSGMDCIHSLSSCDIKYSKVFHYNFSNPFWLSY